MSNEILEYKGLYIKQVDINTYVVYRDSLELFLRFDSDEDMDDIVEYINENDIINYFKYIIGAVKSNNITMS